MKVNYENGLVSQEELGGIKSRVLASRDELLKKSGLGSEFTGWVRWPEAYDKEELIRIKEASTRIREDSDIFIVVGIGGSYLGARACIEAFKHYFKDDKPEILFAGNNLSGRYMADLLEVIKDKDVSINVISKSGTTTEPALAFRILKDFLEDKYGKEGARSRIYVTTDKEKGALKQLAKKEGYESFVIPDDIGGRFSIFTPVGLLPIGVGGLDIDRLLEGARAGMEDYINLPYEENPPLLYSGIRNILYNRGKDIEILVNYEPSLSYLAEWWKQLYGESEGKEGMGIFPASVNFTRDLHSLGQIIQEGKRNIIETTINIVRSSKDVVIEDQEDDYDGLNYLSGKTLAYVNKQAFQGTVMAHVKGEVPNLIIDIPKLDEFYFGKLIYFFKFACGVSGYTLGVNPFNQPGVEEYKKNMFKLLKN